MAQARIIDRKTRIPILPAEGDVPIGEIVFNPEDPKIYAKFVDLYKQLSGDVKKAESLESLTESENEILSKELKTVNDFDAALPALEKMSAAANLTVETMKNVCSGLDDIFGQGVCELFTQGDSDPELLVPLIDAVTPEFEKARDKIKGQYKA